AKLSSFLIATVVVESTQVCNGLSGSLATRLDLLLFREVIKARWEVLVAVVVQCSANLVGVLYVKGNVSLERLLVSSHLNRRITIRIVQRLTNLLLVDQRGNVTASDGASLRGRSLLSLQLRHELVHTIKEVSVNLLLQR